MPSKSELLQTHKWSELTAAEKGRFRDRATYIRRRQEYLASVSKPKPASKPTPVPTASNNPFAIYGPAAPAGTPAAIPVGNPFPFGINSTIPQTVAAPRPAAATTPRPAAATTTQTALTAAGADDTDLRSGTVTGSTTGAEYDLSDSSDLGYMQELDPRTYTNIFNPPTTDTTTDTTTTDTTTTDTTTTDTTTTDTTSIEQPTFDDSGLRNQISELQDIISSMPTTSDFDDLKSGYEDEIGNLQTTIGGYQGQIGGFQTTINSLSDQLRAAQEKANQFKIRDTQYVGNNNSQGIRLKRSKVFDSGAFAFGTNQLNRDFKSPLSISNINL